VVLAIVVLLGALFLVGLFRGQPESAGNRTLSFVSDIRRERYDEAYSQLCPALRDQITLEQFEATGGERFAEARGVHLGSDEEFLGVDTLDRSITSAWSEMIRYPRGDIVTFRFDLVRDGGRWTVCDGEVRSQEMAGSRFVSFRQDVSFDRFEEGVCAACRLTRLDVSFERFVETEGRAVVASRFLGRGDGILTDSEYDDVDTIDQSITSAWIDRSATINGEDVTVRLQFRREDSEWKVCSLERR